MGTKPCQATCPQGISLAWSFNFLDSSFPKGNHHLQRTHSRYPEKQGNWDYSSIPFLDSQNENYPKQEQKVTPESTSLFIGKTINNLWSHRLCNKLVSSHFPFKLHFYMKKKTNGGIYQQILVKHLPCDTHSSRC